MKRAVVTGAAGGMGRATCALLLDRGFSVLAIDSHEERLSRLDDELREYPLLSAHLDLSTPDLGERFEELLQHHEWSTVFGLVNLAGLSAGDELERLSDEAWASSMQVNATAPMVLSRGCIARMRRHGEGSTGRWWRKLSVSIGF